MPTTFGPMMLRAFMGRQQTTPMAFSGFSKTEKNPPD
jgi:hypothetical protein